MTFSQNTVDQATIARHQVQQQIENSRQIIIAARQQVVDLVQQQKTQHAEQAAEATEDAKKAVIEQKTTTQTQLAGLVTKLLQQTGASQEEIIKQATMSAQAATAISQQVAQLFQAIAQPNLDHQEIDSSVS
ncbi:MAG: hypothetical protein F6K14_13985 [Symploca sp. SIO2C1]|nr:hypothetical protein [Symploca sp. SIO2C1]